MNSPSQIKRTPLTSKLHIKTCYLNSRIKLPSASVPLQRKFYNQSLTLFKNIKVPTQRTNMLVHKIFTCRLYKESLDPQNKIIHSYLSIFNRKVQNNTSFFFSLFFTTGTRKYKFITFNSRVLHIALCKCQMSGKQQECNGEVFWMTADTPDFLDKRKMLPVLKVK